MLFFRRSKTPNLRPTLDIEERLRIAAQAEASQLRVMLECRDADVMRLQREVDDLKLGALARVTAFTQRRDAERLAGRNRRGQFDGAVA